MEDCMKNLIAPRSVLIVALLAVIPVIGSCGPQMEGTYTNTGGTVTLDLKSDDKATLTLMGDTGPCTYKVNKDTLFLDCKENKMDFAIQDDGSLTGPGIIGSMKKSK
jgi:hypothetical protein